MPRTIPQITLQDLSAMVSGLKISQPVYLVGLRGYDAPEKNARGIYDDAMILVGPNHLSTYNANTDPSYAFQKHLASLKPGLWEYKLGIHGLSKPEAQQYQALVQAAEVTVERDGEGLDTGFFGINIHRGGVNTTSSLGCQTIVPDQWPTFIENVKEQLARAGQKTIPYALIERSGKMEPASIRYKNPGAMWGSPLAVKWGANQNAVPLNDGKGQNNNIAVFPTYVQGICAQLDLWRTSSHYKNKTFVDAIAIWSGGNDVDDYIAFVTKRVPGMTRNTVINEEFLRGPNCIPFLKAQAWHEAGKPYPAPDADWEEARRRVLDQKEPSVEVNHVEKPATNSAATKAAVAAATAAAAAGGAAASQSPHLDAYQILGTIFALTVLAVTVFIFGYKFIRKVWPWETLTGSQSPEPSSLSPHNSGPSLEDLSAAQSELRSVVSRANSSRKHSALSQPRKPSAKPSQKTQTQPRKSKPQKQRTAKKQPQRRKSR